MKFIKTLVSVLIFLAILFVMQAILYFSIWFLQGGTSYNPLEWCMLARFAFFIFNFGMLYNLFIDDIRRSIEIIAEIRDHLFNN